MFGCFDQPYSTGATLHNKQYPVYVLTETTLTAVKPATNSSTDYAFTQYPKCSRVPIIPLLDPFIICTYSIVGNKIYMLRKKKHINDVILLNRVLMYSVICGQWRQEKASLHSRRKKKILFCMITIGNIVM